MENQQVQMNEVITPIVDTPEVKTKKFGSIVMIIMAILMLGGVGFGVYGMFFQEKEECPKCEECEKCESREYDITSMYGIDDKKAFAEELIEPYLVSFGSPKSTILDYDFGQDNKIIIAARNVALQHINILAHDASSQEKATNFSDTANNLYLSSDAIVNEYRKLFGEEVLLEDKTYGLPKCHYNLNFEGGKEEIYRTSNTLLCGGTGGVNLTKVKDVLVKDGEVVVEVYHDNIVNCGVNGEQEYCLNNEGEASDEFVNKNADRMPQYDMKFKMNNGKFVLKNIEKVE